MKIEQRQLLALVRLAIHPEEEISEVLAKEAIQWEKIFEEAKKQSLIGIAFAGYNIWLKADTLNKDSSPVDDILYVKWYGLVEKIRQRNLLLNHRTSQVCQNFAKDGFRVSIMKGQGNALLYGEDLMLLRSPGDIDVWVEGGYEKVYGYVQKVAPTNEVNELEMPFHVYDDTLIEVHYRPFIIKHLFKNRLLQKYLGSKAEACYSNHVELRFVNEQWEEVREDAIITTVPFNLVQQMAHVKLHLFTGGLGLKQVLDYYYQLVYAEKKMSEEEKDEVVRVLRDIGLERLAKAMMWILSECFMLPKECWLWEPNKEDGEYLLDKFLRTGSFEKEDKSRKKKTKRETFSSFYNIQKQNLKLLRFDRWDWIWGSLWRIYHFIWRKTKGFKH